VRRGVQSVGLPGTIPKIASLIDRSHASFGFISAALKSAPKRRGPNLRRPLHYHEASAIEILNKPFADDLGHELVGVVDALAALKAQGERERVREVGIVRGSAA
jgi:hypothetical protein